MHTNICYGFYAQNSTLLKNKNVHKKFINLVQNINTINGDGSKKCIKNEIL